MLTPINGSTATVGGGTLNLTTGATTTAAQSALAARSAIEGYGTVSRWSAVIFLVGAVLAAGLLRTGTIEADAEPVTAH